MGLEKAKSLLEVKDGKAFLDLIAEQIKHTRTTFGSNVKFILMNSFSTSEDTKVHTPPPRAQYTMLSKCFRSCNIQGGAQLV
jgi:UDP-N-acetylglucosamine pyrophosphorylase